MSDFIRIRRIALAAMTCLGLFAAIGAVPALAQQPTAPALAAAKEIITLKGAARMFEPVVPGVIERARSMFQQTNPGLGKDLAEVAAAARTEYASRYNEIFNEVARLYAVQFSEQEIKDILTFYKSAAGKKLIEEEPKILEQSLTFGQEWANKLSDEVITKMRGEMKKRGHTI